MNEQDDGSTTTKPGIEFIVPPGSSETDILLMKTLNEISTQTKENQRYDTNAFDDLNKALYGDKTQNGSGNKKNNKKKNKKNRKNKKTRKSYKKNSLKRKYKNKIGGKRIKKKPYKKKVSKKKVKSLKKK